MGICEFIVAIVGVKVEATNVVGQRVLIGFVCVYIAGFASTWVGDISFFKASQTKRRHSTLVFIPFGRCLLRVLSHGELVVFYFCCYLGVVSWKEL